MKKPILLSISLLLLSTLLLHAGLPPVDTVSFGKDLRTGDTIYAFRYTMPGKVQDYRAYSDNGTIVYTILHTNKKGTRYKPTGKVMAYDLEHSQKRWERDWRWEYSRMNLMDDFIITSTAFSPYIFLFPMSGYELASLNSRPIGFLRDQNLILSGKITDTNQSNVIYCHSIDGTQKWQRKVSKNFQWSGYDLIDDSTALVIGSGLFRVNLHDGTGWELPAVTHNTDKRSRGMFWASMGFALASGTMAGLTGHGPVILPNQAINAPSKLTEISSNTYITDGYVFWACKENIYKIDLETGDVIWKVSLPEDTASTSHITVIDGLVYLINKGCVDSYTGDRTFGIPYVAQYDATTGDLNYRTGLPAPIHRFGWDDELDYMIFLTSDNRLTRTCASTGEITAIAGPEQPDKEYFMVRRDLLRKDDRAGLYLPLENFYPDATVYISDGENILCYNEELKLIDTFPLWDLYSPYAEIDSFILAGNPKGNILINMSFHPVAEFNYDRMFSISDKYLFGSSGKDAYRIDLSQVLPPETDFQKIIDNSKEVNPYDVIY